ncbi:hypothetical protein BS78_06G114500 [Paspalum vaginatum]|nr:hypothetical protein BS78_06G114500 [Paspalum vaginatum]
MSGATAAAADHDDDVVVHDFAPLLVVYRSGRVERPLALPSAPPGRDAATGVLSKDVPLSAHTFARLYLPPSAAAAEQKLPVLVYVHGGGFVVGSAASAVVHRWLNALSAACGALAVSVDYRLAPEHPVAAAYEDSLAALRWALSSGAGADPWLAERGDPARVFLAGESAGANVCHSLAVRPDVRGAGIRGLLLVHPWFWGKERVGGEPRAPTVLQGLWEFLCPGAAEADDPRMNPMARGAPGLGNLACAKVMVCVAGDDVLRWRGKVYAEEAARARGPQLKVELFESEGVGHGFYLMDTAAREKAQELLDRIAAFVGEE